MAILNGPAINSAILDEFMQAGSTPQDLFGPEGVLAQFIARLIELALQVEMNQHLGHDPG